MQKPLKFVFLIYLGGVVGAPFLPIGLLDRDGFGVGLSLAVVGVFSPDDDFSRVNMLASELPGGEVWTSAMRLSGVGLDDVGVVTTLGLRRDKPPVAVVAALKIGRASCRERV